MISGTARALPGRPLGTPGGSGLPKMAFLAFRLKLPETVPETLPEITRIPARNYPKPCPKSPLKYCQKSASEWPDIQNRVLLPFEGKLYFCMENWQCFTTVVALGRDGDFVHDLG